jgi:flavorubredoxin
MDIEGSEKEVLKNLEIRPRVLIVESHGFKGSKTKRIRELVSQLGYNIQTIDLAENTEFAKQNDVKIVTGIKEN